MSNININQILSHLTSKDISYTYEGPLDLYFIGIRSLNHFVDKSISFYRGDSPSIVMGNELEGRLLVLKKSLAVYFINRNNILFTENPDLVICLIWELFETRVPLGVHPTAMVSDKALIQSNCSIGAFAVIGDNVELGNNVIIDECVVIKNCKIGDNTHIYPGVKIGSPGLGSHKDKHGVWHQFPHVGRVVIGKDVIIQDNSVIARGSLTDTIIDEGVHIGPLSWLAHNVNIKKNVLIGQSVTIAGSVVVGEGSIIWGNASVRDGINIGTSCVIGMGAVVIKDVSNNTIIAGNPGYELRKK